MSVLFLTKYSKNGASSRYRSFQYLPYLEDAGFQCTVAPLFDEMYLIHKYQDGKAWKRDVLRALLRRIHVLWKVRHFNLVVVEKEVLPYFFSLPELWVSLLGIPYVVDYDDALFHQYDKNPSLLVRLLLGSKIRRVMRYAALVTVGNSYLANYAYSAKASRVEIVPTVVDLNRYPLSVSNGRSENDVFTIGWIGSPSTAVYLKEILPALVDVCDGGRAQLRLIGSGTVNLPGVPIKIIPWTEASEASEIVRFDVGIMPLPDNPWERGKCGLKLIQYMACHLPVVASPVGVNTDIVEEGVNGYLASDHVAWVRSLCCLRDDFLLRKKMGAAGRLKVEKKYCIQVTAPRLVGLFQSIVEPSFQKLEK